MSLTIFISHSSQDKGMAEEVLRYLESNGQPCWIAPRDISPGADWAESILDGVDSSCGMVLVITSNTDKSPHIRREVERAVSNGIPVFPLIMEFTKRAKWMQYYISAHQWIDASQGKLHDSLPDLLKSIRTIDDGISGSEQATIDEDAAQKPAPAESQANEEEQGGNSKTSKHEASASEAKEEAGTGIKELLREIIDKDATELHLDVGLPPQFRVGGVLMKGDQERLSPDAVKSMVDGLFREAHWKRFNEEKSVTVAFGLKGLSRFRMHAYKQRGVISAVISVIPSSVQTLDELFGEDAAHFAGITESSGISLICTHDKRIAVLVLAALIDHFNNHKQGMILTVENPILFVHRHRKGTVSQLEIGFDVDTYHQAVKLARNMTPDLVMIDEIRNMEILDALAILARRNRLCLSSIPEPSVQDALIHLYELGLSEGKEHILDRILRTLSYIVVVNNVWDINGNELFIPELYKVDNDIAALIKEDRISSAIEAIRTDDRAILQKNESIMRLIRAGCIELEDGIRVSDDPENLENRLSL